MNTQIDAEPVLNANIEYPKIELSKAGAAIYLSLHTNLHDVKSEEAAHLNNEVLVLLQKIDTVHLVAHEPEHQTWKRQAQAFAKEILSTLYLHPSCEQLSNV